MFGVVQPCSCRLPDDLLAQWRAHLCGSCLTLRDRHGQLFRALTNTDAVMLSVLVEAQSALVPERTTAGPCPLRGMRSAAVVPTSAVSTRLGATASLALAAAKATDLVDESAHGLGGPGRVGSELARRAASVLGAKARSDEPMSTAIDIDRLLNGLTGQAEVERRTCGGGLIALREVIRPSATATAQVFAASATVAGAPGNTDALRRMGSAFGALAHVLDAVQDRAKDVRAGSFNPIVATGIFMDEVRGECRLLERQLRQGFSELRLVYDRLLKIVLIDGTHAAVHRAFGEGATTTCSTGRNEAPEPPNIEIAPDPPRKLGWGGVLPWVGVYCTGYACCAEHVNPCTGRRHHSSCSGCDCSGCPDFDGCEGCCECCECCDCNC